jgi:hypothetical protein
MENVSNQTVRESPGLALPCPSPHAYLFAATPIDALANTVGAVRRSGSAFRFYQVNPNSLDGSSGDWCVGKAAVFTNARIVLGLAAGCKG